MERCLIDGAQYSLVAKGDRGICVPDKAVTTFSDGRPDGICDSPCAGDPSEYCGGPESYDLYQAYVPDHEDVRTGHEARPTVGECSDFMERNDRMHSRWRQCFGPMISPSRAECSSTRMGGRRRKYSRARGFVFTA